MVVAVKVFKKTSPNGKVTVYLGKRDFLDHLDNVDPIDGIVVVDNEYLKGRKVYVQVRYINFLKNVAWHYFARIPSINLFFKIFLYIIEN